jgi:Condensation domain/Taurine catabolism dioxygenase TauD, TfdA family
MSQNNIEDAYPLAPAQEGMLFHSLYAPESGVYVVQTTGVWRDLDASLLEQAWQKVTDRHAVLRTAFAWEGLGRPLQVVGRRVKMPFEIHDWRGQPVEGQEAQFQAYLDSDRRRGFRLTRAPLMRLSLIRTAENVYRFVWTHHHILLDGWSVFVVLKEVFTVYESLAKEQEAQLPEARPFRHYIEWYQKQDVSNAKVFWQQMLEGFAAPKLAGMKRAHDGTPGEVDGYGERLVQFSAETTAALQAIAKRNHLTMGVLLKAAWSVLLSHYTGEKDVAFGVTYSGRPGELEEINSIVGMFINVLPMRVRLSQDQSLTSLLGKLHELHFDIQQYQHTPLVRVQNWSNTPRGQSLFESILTIQNYPIDSSVKEQGRGLNISDVQNISRTNYPITIIASLHADLAMLMVYDRQRFDADSIERIQEHFTAILSSFTAGLDSSVDTLIASLAEIDRGREVSAQKKQEVANLNRFKKVKPKSVKLPQGDMVRSSLMFPGEKLPLVLEPAVDNLNLADWAGGNRDFIEQKLLEHGGILFKGFDVDSVSKFERFASTVCPSLFERYGDLPREEASSRIYGSTPYPADKAILFHNESSHMQSWPLRIFFYCLKAADEGGETPIVDCRKLYSLIPAEVRERLAQRRVMYVRNYIDGLDVSWKSFFKTTDKSQVERLCRESSTDFEWEAGGGLRTSKVCRAVSKHPATGEDVLFNQLQLHHVSCLDAGIRESLLATHSYENLPRNVFYGDGSPIEDSVIQALCETTRKASVSFPWQEGNILMLDNMLTAHARNPYRGTRKIVVAMGEMIYGEDR